MTDAILTKTLSDARILNVRPVTYCGQPTLGADIDGETVIYHGQLAPLPAPVGAITHKITAGTGTAVGLTADEAATVAAALDEYASASQEIQAARTSAAEWSRRYNAKCEADEAHARITDALDAEDGGPEAAWMEAHKS